MTRQAEQEAEVLVNCAKCPRRVCETKQWDKGPDNCPSKIRTEVIRKATEKCVSPENLRLAYNASKQEASCYIKRAGLRRSWSLPKECVIRDWGLLIV